MNKTYKLNLPKDKVVIGAKARIENNEVYIDCTFRNEFETGDLVKDVQTNTIGIFADTIRYGVKQCFIMDKIMDDKSGRILNKKILSTEMNHLTDEEEMKYATAYLNDKFGL